MPAENILTTSTLWKYLPIWNVGFVSLVDRVLKYYRNRGHVKKLTIKSFIFTYNFYLSLTAWYRRMKM